MLINRDCTEYGISLEEFLDTFYVFSLNINKLQFPMKIYEAFISDIYGFDKEKDKIYRIIGRGVTEQLAVEDLINNLNNCNSIYSIKFIDRILYMPNITRIFKDPNQKIK